MRLTPQEFEIGHVLFIDIVGYSKLLIEDQKEQLNRLNELVLRSPQVREATDEQLLRLPTGDGMALVFRRSAVEPTRCAVEVAEALKQHPKIPVRMGIHSGPVSTVTDVNGRTNLAGPGINIAQRVMDCGDAGHILVSRRVADDLAHYRQWAPHLHDLGECEVKHGVLVHLVNLHIGSLGNPALPGKIRDTREKEASIAVLPFLNRGASADDEYFSDGLADELLSVLSKIKGIRVTARTSSFHFKGKDTTIAEIGSALKVATVLEGSVRKAGNRVRISVQLVSVADSSHLWSETYDRTLEDIFAVQDDIAHSVVKELRTTLLGEAADSDASTEAKAEVARAAKGRGTDPEAHRLYLLAGHLLLRFAREDTTKGIEYLNQAVTQEPEFALAWVSLAYAYAREAEYGWAPVADGYGRAREAVERALALEPDLAEGHAAMGWIRLFHDWDWRGAEASTARALDLAQGSAAMHGMAGALARNVGRVEEAIAFARRALQQDPLSAPAYHNLGTALRTEDRFAEAEAAYRKALELAPQRTGTHSLLSLVLLAQGRGEEALGEAMREPEAGFRLEALAVVHHVLGHGAESDAAVRELIEKHSDTMAYQVSDAHAACGRADAAFEWLERAYAQRDSGLTELKVNPYFRPFHGDPRWGAFLKKMGFED